MRSAFDTPTSDNGGDRGGAEGRGQTRDSPATAPSTGTGVASVEDAVTELEAQLSQVRSSAASQGGCGPVISNSIGRGDEAGSIRQCVHQLQPLHPCMAKPFVTARAEEAPRRTRGSHYSNQRGGNNGSISTRSLFLGFSVEGLPLCCIHNS